jgi:hypothetical protein
MKRTTLGGFLLALALTLAAPLAAATVDMPVTAADHQLAAKAYRDRAEAFRQDAKENRQRAQVYLRKENKPAQLTGQDEPQAAKIVNCLKSMASLADQMASEAEKAADYHTLRAKELQGAKP